MTFLTTLIVGIFGQLFNAAGSWIKAWYDTNKAQQDAWLAKTLQDQMASVKDVNQLQIKISAAPATVAHDASPSDWNVKAGTAVLLLCLLWLPGCVMDRTVYAESKYPLLQPPARPMIPSDPPQWTPRELLVTHYAADLEAVIDAYNAAAKAHNAANGY